MILCINRSKAKLLFLKVRIYLMIIFGMLRIVINFFPIGWSRLMDVYDHGYARIRARKADLLDSRKGDIPHKENNYIYLFSQFEKFSFIFSISFLSIGKSTKNELLSCGHLFFSQNCLNFFLLI